MEGLYEVYQARAVPKEHAHAAFAFHATASSGFVWPRTVEYIEKLAVNGSLFAAWNKSTGSPVGLAYGDKLDERLAEWEVGGLTVEKSAQKQGLGSVLLQFALVNLFAQNFDPLPQPFPHIVAHVHQDNQRPRSILQKLRFEQTGTVRLDPRTAPSTLKQNTEGLIIGEQFTGAGLIDLSRWLDSFNGRLSPTCRCELDFGPLFSIENMRTAIRELARQVRPVADQATGLTLGS